MTLPESSLSLALPSAVENGSRSCVRALGKPKALDLFCGAGGATRGLQLAGFHVTGVDIKPKPRYCGDVFIQADALEFPLEGYDFIWASPPCQAFTALRWMPDAKQHPNLIPETRRRLVDSGIPYTIENVMDAPLGGNLIMLCGTMFGLRTPDGKAELRRHRLFETSFSIPLRPACVHGRPVCAVYGGHVGDRCRSITVTGSTPQMNVIKNRVRLTFTMDDARSAMGINWMTMADLSQAIPPAYSEFIGHRALEEVNSR